MTGAPIKNGHHLSIDQGVSNCLKFISAIMIALHHYSQFVVQIAEYQPLTIGGATTVPVF